MTRVSTKRTKPHEQQVLRAELAAGAEVDGDELRDGRPAVLEDVGGDDEGAAQDDGDGDGLLEGPAEPEHDGADHAAPAEGEHHRPDHLPPAGAEGEGRLALARRGQGEDLPADRGDDGHDHDPDDQSGDEDRGVERRARHLEERDERQVAGEPGAEARPRCGWSSKTAHRPKMMLRDGGGQVDQGDERAPAPRRGVLAQEEGGGDGDRRTDDHGHHGHFDGADQGGEHTEGRMVRRGSGTPNG